MEIEQFQYTLIRTELNIMSKKILYQDCLFVSYNVRRLLRVPFFDTKS